METIQLERFDEFGYTYIAPRWVRPAVLYNAASEQNTSLKVKLISTVSSGSTAKTWSCQSTTPSFSSTSTSILIGILQMHVSHASFSLETFPLVVMLAASCTICVHNNLISPIHTISPISIHSMLHSNVCSDGSERLCILFGFDIRDVFLL